MKKVLLATSLLAAVAGGGFALAQAPNPAPVDHTAHHAPTSPRAQAPRDKSGPPQGGMGGATGQMGAGANGMMMGGGMMEHGHGHGAGNGSGMMMGDGMCPMMMGGSATKVEVKKIDKGVTITMTSPDPATVARLQKMAEAMRLMHEATAQ